MKLSVALPVDCGGRALRSAVCRYLTVAADWQPLTRLPLLQSLTRHDASEYLAINRCSLLSRYVAAASQFGTTRHYEHPRWHR